MEVFILDAGTPSRKWWEIVVRKEFSEGAKTLECPAGLSEKLCATMGRSERPRNETGAFCGADGDASRQIENLN